MIARTSYGRRSPGDVALGAFSILVLAVLALPIAAIVAVSLSPGNIMEFPPRGLSLRWYANYLGDPVWLGATQTSVTAAALTALASLVLGSLVALVLVRSSIPGKTAVRLVIMSPLIVPKIILAVGLYFFYVQLRILGTMTGLVAAHTLIAVPYVVMIMSAALYGFDRRLEWAAANLGATPARSFLHVTMPVLRPALLSAGLFAFVASFDDIILSLFLTKLSAPTLPRQIWVNVQQIIDPTIAAVSTLMTLVSALGLWLVALAQRSPRRPHS